MYPTVPSTAPVCVTTAVASDNAVLDGVTVVAAAGNSGPGEATLGSPAAGTRVIAVAANTDPGSHYSWAVDALDASSFPPTQTGVVTPAANFPTQSCIDRIKVFAQAGTPTPPDGAMAQYYALVDDPLVTWPASVRGRIALIKESGLASATFFDICNQAVNAGAVGVLLRSTVTSPTAVRCSIPAANIALADADRLISAMPSQTSGALSSFPLRMINDLRLPFVGDTTDFSSRGPVQGYGQVKPDVSAPGANVLAAVPPASLLGALEQGNYGAISGTSMATPHVTGAVALIKHAHQNWSPDWIRTALINTATNMRDADGAPKADGLDTETVNDQGGGLINVYEAINAKALMGVAGRTCAANDTDCKRTTPSILGSYSFGAIPVINNRTTYTVPVTVTIRDISGQGGTYNLNLSNSRDLQQSGVGASLSTTSVSVPANGTATFTVSASIDGNVLRDGTMSETTVTNCTSVNFITHQIQLQWYVTASRSDGGEKLRMPFYLRPVPSVPATPTITPQNFSGIVPASAGGVVGIGGVTRIEHSFQVSSSVYRIHARLDYTAQNAEDMDFYLFGPDGKEVTHSAIFGGPEEFDATVSKPGTYKYRVEGFANGPVQYTIAGSLFAGPPPPALQTIPGDFTNAAGDHVDFDGNVTLNWTPRSGDQGFEIEKSTDYKDGSGNIIPDDQKTWTTIGSVNGTTGSFNVTGLTDGRYFFRIHALTAGQIGQYVTAGSAATSVVVGQRTLVDITSFVKANVSGSIGTTSIIDVTLLNKGTQTYLPLVDMNVVGISSASGTVVITNADNQKNGTSVTNAALFGYSQKIGADEIFSPQELTGKRTITFSNSASEMFTFQVLVTAYQGSPGSSSSTGGGSGGASQQSSSTVPGLPNLLTSGKSVLQFTVNPLTNSIAVQLVSLR